MVTDWLEWEVTTWLAAVLSALIPLEEASRGPEDGLGGGGRRFLHAKELRTGLTSAGGGRWQRFFQDERQTRHPESSRFIATRRYCL